MGEFRFRRFTVSNERSAMKVNTDGVLLGASMTLLPNDHYLLDIGTGTGTVALMAAQRLADVQTADVNGSGIVAVDCSAENNGPDDCGFKIVGIDIDKDSADEAAMNFSASPWHSGLHSLNLSLQDFSRSAADELLPVFWRPEPSEGPGKKHLFDAIFSNPPYFESSLKAPDERRRNARHADTLSYRDIFSEAGLLLKPTGRLSLILPAEQETDAVREAAASGFWPFRIISVRTVPRKVPSRVILEFSRFRRDILREHLAIQENGTYTADYLSLVKDFLLI